MPSILSSPRRKSYPLPAATWLLLIILSIGSMPQRKHTQDGINAGILAAHAQSPPLTRAIRSVHDGSNNQFTGVTGERVRKHRLSRQVESDPGYHDLSNNRERVRYARQLAKKKKDSSHGNKAGKEPSKSKHTPSPSVTAGTTPFPTTMGDKSGKKHHFNTPAPTQSDETLFPTQAEKQISTKAKKPASSSSDSKTAKKFAKSVKPQVPAASPDAQDSNLGVNKDKKKKKKKDNTSLVGGTARARARSSPTTAATNICLEDNVDPINPTKCTFEEKLTGIYLFAEAESYLQAFPPQETLHIELRDGLIYELININPQWVESNQNILISNQDILQIPVGSVVEGAKIDLKGQAPEVVTSLSPTISPTLSP